MKRDELTDIFREAALAVGYSFYTGAIHRAASEIRTYPAAWLEPLVMKSCDRRTEGSVIYRATLHLMALPTAQGNEGLWEGLETDALTLKHTVEQDSRVSRVSTVSCIPASQTLTPHGEVSLTLTCEVTMWYYL
jgi:hypothetical protein